MEEKTSSNLTDVLSGGGSFLFTSHCRISQALLHYILLGYGVSPVFHELVEELKKIPDRENGYFLLDFPYFV